MLAQLADQGWIDEAARDELDEAYVFLRTVEHRLQMVRDEQTHTMPADREGLARIARLMGYAGCGCLRGGRCGARSRRVARRYSELFESAPDLSGDAGSLVFTGGEDDPETLETLRQLGFQDPEHVTETVRGWHFGRFAAMRSTAARERPDGDHAGAARGVLRGPATRTRRCAPSTACCRRCRPGRSFSRFSPRIRELLDLLATVLGAAPRLAEIFARRPHVVDALRRPALVRRAWPGGDGLAERLGGEPGGRLDATRMRSTARGSSPPSSAS